MTNDLKKERVSHREIEERTFIAEETASANILR